MYLLRKPILAVSASERTRSLLTRAPVTKAVVDRFVAGENVAGAVAAVRRLRADGLAVTMDHLGEDVSDVSTADANVAAYLSLIAELDAARLAAGAEVSVKLSAIGRALPASAGGPATVAGYALAGATRIADAAYAAGARMTLDMEDHTTVDATLETLAALRREHADVGVAIQAMLLRTPRDLVELTGPGSRVRLVKGAYDEPGSVAFVGPDQVDRAYVRAMKTLMAGQGYPMIGSHDPTMVDIAARLAADHQRAPGTWEHQMLYGIRSGEQRRLVGLGRQVRVYVPYGTDWYGYFTRRLAERPANLAFFLRALLRRD